MTRLGLRPYQAGGDLPPGSVPVSVVVLTLNEEPNICRCLASVAWADQVVVVDSGSTDGTVPLARAAGAEVVAQPWLGFSAQREYALRLPLLRHDWVYFVDADEWVSSQLATEIAMNLVDPRCAAFAHRFRIVFMGRWIRHCGWYSGSWIIRLVDRRYTKFDGSMVGERACVDGRVLRLAHDIVDEDLKGLATWLHKHVRYAELKCERRDSIGSLPERLRALRHDGNTRPPSPQHPQGGGLPRCPGQARRAVFLHVHRQARLPRWHGRAPLLLLPRVVRDERGVAPGGSPCLREDP